MLADISFSPKPILRKLEMDESTLYDKFCPDCKTGKLIFKWNWVTHAYIQSSARCNSVNCDYGNKGAKSRKQHEKENS